MAVRYDNLQPANPLGALVSGYKAGGAIKDDRNRRNALAKYASGDRAGASDDLIAAGDFDTGIAVKKIAAADSEAERRSTVGAQYAKGDASGAHAAARAAGDFDLDDALSKLDDRQAAEATKHYQAQGGYFYDLKKLPYAERKAKIAADKGHLTTDLGFSEAQVGGYDPTDANLETSIGQALTLAEKVKRDTDAQARDDKLHTPEWRERKNADTSTEFVDLNPLNRTGGETAPAAAAQPATGPAKPPRGGIYDAVAQIAGKSGAKPEEVGYLQRLAQVESDGDPGAQNGRSTGLFQFHPDTFAAVGGHGDIHDVGAQTNAALALSRRDRQNLQHLGIEPTDANVYIMHQQGAGGGRALLTAPPETGAVAVLTPIYGNADTAKRAIVGNGGKADMTAGQFVDYWRQRWSGGGEPAAPDPALAPTGQAPQTSAPGAPTVKGSAAQPKPQGRMATAEDKQRLKLDPDVNYWIEADGKPAPIQGEKPNKPLTEYQGKSVEYLNAALGGNERMNALAAEGLYKPKTATDSLFTKEKDGTIRLILRSDADRQYMQAAKEWLAPILRKDTGAAVTDSELAYYMDIYIPKFEDSPKVMWQKAQARDQKMRSLYGANRGAYDSTFGAPEKWKVLSDPRGIPQKPGTPAKAPAAGKAKPSLDEIFR